MILSDIKMPSDSVGVVSSVGKAGKALEYIREVEIPKALFETQRNHLVYKIILFLSF